MAKSKTKNFFVWVIMGLLAVGLLGFGAAGVSGTVRTVGTVGDKPLSTQAYFSELQSLMQINSQQVGRQLTFLEAESAGLPARALSAIVAERSLDHEAAVLGLSVGDAAISQQVLANPSFRGSDGAFDTDTYRQALAQNGLSVRDYEAGLRDGASRAMVQGAVFTGIPDPKVFAETLAEYTREGRTFTWATLTPQDVDINVTEPTDADLQAYYDANPDSYTSLETRVLRYVWLTPDMIQDPAAVSDDDLRTEYDARIDDYVQPERRLIERLAFSTQDAAQAALDAINAGETTFPDLVTDRGLTLEDVDAGDVTEAQMGAAGPAIFALETGGVTGPFDSDLGPALYRMNAVLAAREETFEQAEPELREAIAALDAADAIDAQIDPITNLIAGGADLSDVADQTDMVLGELDWTEDTTGGIADYAAFRDLAESQDIADFAELDSLDDGGLFALEVLEVRPPALIPLDDVRDDVRADWTAAQTDVAVVAEAEKIRARLNEGVQQFSFVGLEWLTETNLTRQGFVNGAPPTFLSDIFEMTQGEVRVIPNGDDALIVRLDEIVAADPTDPTFEAAFSAIGETGAEGIAQDIYELYSRAVQQRTEVQINDQAINAVHLNFR
ncbi:peptidylprolyl isomerase [Octadecabacter sp.]|nr:peptidylprolyl isomerase [Octadecabacter sp.]